MKCNVTIESVGKGIMFHNPQISMFVAKTSKKVIPSHEQEAENGCYWNADKTELVIPSWNVHRGLVRAASGLKLPTNKKVSLGPIIAGDITLSPDLLGFGTKEYVIDVRRAVVQRQGILRARPLLPKWRLTFTVEWETSNLGADFWDTVLRELLTILGERIGLAEYRPEKGGPFGRFRIVSIAPVKN